MKYTGWIPVVTFGASALWLGVGISGAGCSTEVSAEMPDAAPDGSGHSDACTPPDAEADAPIGFYEDHGTRPGCCPPVEHVACDKIFGVDRYDGYEPPLCATGQI